MIKKLLLYAMFLFVVAGIVSATCLNYAVDPYMDSPNTNVQNTGYSHMASPNYGCVTTVCGTTCNNYAVNPYMASPNSKAQIESYFGFMASPNDKCSSGCCDIGKDAEILTTVFFP